MKFEILIDALARRVGLDPSGLLQENRCSLRFDDAHEVTLEHELQGDVIYFVSMLGGADVLRDVQDYRRLLQAALPGGEMDGAAFALYAATNEIVLWRRCAAASFTQYSDLEAVLNAFLGQVIHWKAALFEGRRAEASTPATAPQMDPAAWMHHFTGRV